jgi:hypothetical protein
MTIQAKLLCAIAASGFAAFAVASPAQALTQQECSAKYQAAKTAGTLNGQKWNDFRKSECSADAAPAAAPTAAAPAPAPAAPKAAEAKPAPAPKPMAAPAAPVAVGNAVFPTAVDPKFAQEKPGRAREKTCAAQWDINKTANTTGGMKWNPKGGGGYYPECNRRLKG